MNVEDEFHGKINFKLRPNDGPILQAFFDVVELYISVFQEKGQTTEGSKPLT